MTEPLISEADATSLGYRLSVANVATRTTLGENRVRRAAADRNGPGLGAACPVLPHVKVRKPNSPPAYRFRIEDVDTWLSKVMQPWPPPPDPIDSAEALMVLNGGIALKPNSPEYKRVIARLARANLTTWQLLGQKRYSRAKVEQIAADLAEHGITTKRISQADKGRLTVSPHLVDARAAGEILGRLRKSGKPLDEATVARWATESPALAIKVAGRWWFDPKKLAEFVERARAAECWIQEPKRGPHGEILGHEGGKLQVGCMAAGCSEVMERSWSEVHEIRNREILKRHVYCSLECVAASAEQWRKPRGAKVMAPCTCIRDDGTTCGRLTRVRIGREHQIEEKRVRCKECVAAALWPLDGKRSLNSRQRQSATRKAAFANGEPWAKWAAERFAALAEELLRSPTRMVRRGAKQRRRELTAEERRATEYKARSRNKKGRAGRKRSGLLADELRRIADEVIASHTDELDGLKRAELLAEIGIVAWQENLSTLRQDFPANRHDPECYGPEWRRSVIARVGHHVAGYLDERLKALQTARS